MDLNRNHFFVVGVIVLLLGIQLRLVDSFVLTPEASKFVVKHWQKQQVEQGNLPAAFMASTAPAVAPQQRVRPPEWLGWALISIGSVLVLHALAMKKPGG